MPNRREHVLYWQRMALRRFAIDKIEWHLTDDDYFAKFPSSVAMKIYLIEDLSVLPVSGTINMG